MRQCCLVVVLLACGAVMGGCHDGGFLGGGGGDVGPGGFHEDFTPINPAACAVMHLGGEWKIVQNPGNVWMFGFGNNATSNAKAHLALATLQFYHATHVGYVVRPTAVMTYLLVNGQSPIGPGPGETAVAFDWHNVDVQLAFGSWEVWAPGVGPLLNFGSNETAARDARWVIQKHKFTSMCTVGQGGLPPNPALLYFRK